MNMPSSTIWISGACGFIGRALQSEGHQGCNHKALLSGEPLAEHIQTIVHAGRDPQIGTPEYRLEADIELEIARFARERGLNYVMLSSRKVYGAQSSPILEDVDCQPTDAYGNNKFAMEQHLLGLLGERLTILRLSNVFGYEPGRKTFMGAMLDGLASKGEIHFNMSPMTVRDFIPIAIAAKAIAVIANKPPGGVLNIGSGVAFPTGELAEAVIAGFGQGRLYVTDERIRDAFHLDIGRMLAETGIQISKSDILDAAIMVGANFRKSLQN